MGKKKKQPPKNSPTCGRHTDREIPAIKFIIRGDKKLSELTAFDIPPGLDAEDVAIDGRL